MIGHEMEIEVSLLRDDAVVLLDWLSSVDFDSIPMDHRSIKQGLVDLLNQLEQSPAASYQPEELQEARDRLASTMGW